MSDSEKPTFLGLEGMLQDLGANSAKPKSAPPPSAGPDSAEPPTLDPPTLDRKKTARESPSAKGLKPPPLPLFAYGARSNGTPVPGSSDDAPLSSPRTRDVDRGDPVSALEPYADIVDLPTERNDPTDVSAAPVVIEAPPPTEVSPATQPVSLGDLEPEGPKSVLAKTRVSAAISAAAVNEALAAESEKKPESTLPIELATKADEASTPAPETPTPASSAKATDTVSAKPVTSTKKAEKKADGAAARFPTLQALDAGEEKPRSGMWFAVAAVLFAGVLGWYFLHDRLSGGRGTAQPADTLQPAASAATTQGAPSTTTSSIASVLPVTTAPPASAASAIASAAATTTAPLTTTAGGAHATTTATTTATTHATAHGTVAAPPTTTTPTATTPPPPTTTATATATATAPPTSTKPSLINEP